MNKPIALIVEDDAIQLMMAAELAEEAGYEPVLATNADEAMAVLETRSDVRVIMTDVSMPGSMDGLDLARIVHNRWPPIRIVVVSGHVPRTEAELPARSYFFMKPYPSQRMVSTLKGFVFG